MAWFEFFTATRRATAAWLESQGVTGAALDALLSETAAARHASRVAAARQAAEDYYLAACKLCRYEVGGAALTAAAGSILWADVIGVGGQDGVEGTGTSRHPALAGCGKGRKHASDGDAWSAAILQAAVETAGRFLVNENGCLVYQLNRVNAILGIDPAVIRRPWLHAIAREGLRRAAGLSSPGGGYGQRGWHPAAPFEAPPESLAKWAAAVNDAVASPYVEG